MERLSKHVEALSRIDAGMLDAILSMLDGIAKEHPAQVAQLTLVVSNADTIPRHVASDGQQKLLALDAAASI